MERPSIRQLESLVAVADHKSFRRAADSLGISQPALSLQVQGAETTLGVQVFERDRRSVLITPAGEDIVGRARQALDAVDAVADAARRRGEPLVGPLRLGVIPTVAPYWLPALLPAVRKKFPRLELILREEQTSRLLAMLNAGQLDIAFVALPVPGDLTAAQLVREDFVLAAPRGAAITKRRGKLAETDLDHETVLLLEDGHCLRDRVDGSARDEPAHARADGRRRARRHAIARSSGGRARPVARTGRARRVHEASGADARPRLANVVGAPSRVQDARRRDARGGRALPREAASQVDSRR